jgi:ATP-dependent exoDNAse (exonuclease V) beta subunit
VVRPFVDRADEAGDTLLAFATDLAVACGLGARALALDPEGGLGDELDRLLARAAELAREGAGPRAWLADLLRTLDARRAAGRPARDAINLMTCHSSKGLEWPVVIPVGLARTIKFLSAGGLRILPGPAGSTRLVLGSQGIDAETREGQKRAQRRDLVRLLYVTLTRARVALVVPWSGARPESNSFAELWGLDPAVLAPLPPAAPAPASGPPPAQGSSADERVVLTVPAPAPALPRRVLPHQLAGAPDLARTALHESSQDLPSPVRDAVDPLEYGVWWHETLEFIPWEGSDEAVAAHGAAAQARAMAGGFGDRAGADWARFLGSEPWRLMREPRWHRLAEVGVFAPLKDGEWIDGVMDLVLHDPGSGELWIVDWKTNRRRPGEGDAELLARLGREYQGQLAAYGGCTRAFFPGSAPRLWIYATEAGAWIEPKTAG